MEYIERILSFILRNRRGHDAGLISRTAAFAHCPKPTITLECPNIGPSGSKIPSKYGFFEEGMFPVLKWTLPVELNGKKEEEVKEWFLAVEDPDAPLAIPVAHGLYYSIPANRTSVTDADFQKPSPPVPGDGSISDDFELSGGFKYGLNRRQMVYLPPRGMLGHGPHRYFYEIVALREPIDTTKLSKTGATREELVKQLEGKVIAWGEWMGVWERT